MWATTAVYAAETEQVVVYGEPFRRWDGTRWEVGAELLMPFGATFALDDREAFSSELFRLSAVIGCALDGAPGKRRADVVCAIEDAALEATTWAGDDPERVQRVLSAVDAKLTGAVLQLQVDAAGGVTNVDLEGWTADNLAERAVATTLTQIAARLVAGFHLRVPPENAGGGQWPEPHPMLMDLPGLTGSAGASDVVHLLSPYRGHWVLQSIGEGTAMVDLPHRVRELVHARPEAAAGAKPDPLEPADVPKLPFGVEMPKLYWEGMPALVPGSPPVGNTTILPAPYGVELAAVGTFVDGVLTERVWVVVAEPSPSGPGGPPFVNRGHLRRLGPEERPDLGPTRQVAYPGTAEGPLPSW